MPITFSCPCGRQLQVGDEYAGKRARCPECDAVVSVPSADTAVPPPLPPAARPSKRAKLAEPEETEDDIGAAAGSLNPLDRRNRGSKRSRDEDEDEDEGDYRPRRRHRPEPPRKFWNNKVTGGLTCMVIAAVWFCGGLAADVIFYFPPILFVIGVVSLIRGLVTGRDE